jgi:hypothetical protein
MKTRITDGQLLIAIWRWHWESLHTHIPKKVARIKQIILALESL